MAPATERLRLGSLVFSVTYRHPAVLAKWAATVDHVSGGRLLLGIGAGWQENEHAQYGIELGSRRTRIERFEEACQVIVGLLREDVTKVDGGHYVVTDAIAEPKPVQRPLPILIGGKGDRMMGVVARYADAWNMWGLPDAIAERAAVLDARCTEIGRDPGSVERSCQALWFVTDDVARADADDRRRADAGHRRAAGAARRGRRRLARRRRRRGDRPRLHARYRRRAPRPHGRDHQRRRGRLSLIARHPWAPCSAAVLVSLVGALLLAGCRVDVTVDLVIGADGTGDLTVTATADAEVVEQAAGLAEDLRLDDAIAAGWTVEGRPRRTTEG